MRASVLQNPVDQKQQKEVCEPIIKKSLFDDCVKTARFRRRWSTRLSQQQEDSSGPSHQNKELKASTFGTFISNKNDHSSSEALFGNRKEPKNSDLPSHTLGNKITVKECHTLQEASTTNCTSISSVKKGNFPALPGSTKRIQRRRSAAVLCVRTPMKRKTINSEARSTNKLISSSVSSKIPAPKGSQNRIRLKRSLVLGRQSLQPQTTDKMATSHNEGLDEENKIQNDVTNYKSHKVDASTNTTINLANIKHVDLKVLEDIENLLKEQEELNTKASLLQKKTTARRLEMKEKRLVRIIDFSSFLFSLHRIPNAKIFVSFLPLSLFFSFPVSLKQVSHMELHVVLQKNYAKPGKTKNFRHCHLESIGIVNNFGVDTSIFSTMCILNFCQHSTVFTYLILIICSYSCYISSRCVFCYFK